jgi:hypothetical protein
MSNQEQICQNILDTYQALEPAFLSAFNWLKLNQGAVIKPQHLQTIGIWREKGYYKQNKRVILPVIVNNVGMKPGMITNIEAFFDGPNGEQRLEVLRRVEMDPDAEVKRGEEEEYFAELAPKFPVFVPAKEGAIIMLDCVDRDHDIIPLDEQLDCRLRVTTDGKKKQDVKFRFKLNSEQYLPTVEGFEWIDLTDHAEVSKEETDRDILISVLKEMDVIAINGVLNSDGTQFDQTVEYGGTKH